ncbi:Senescence regulator [Corchorus capsularis]|uniref:Senescence regulator n=1 Tax=Corchorus capsularis TaxID=210143 RepID=A0A1R3KGN3_COCAP|nr:Senescence regulator [Corchorus capsularis]
MDRFLGVTSGSSATASDGEELTEDDIFWTTTDFTEQDHLQIPSTVAKTNSHNRRPSFSQSSGILAALREPNHYQILYRKPIISSSSSDVQVGQTIPRPMLPEREYSRKFQQQQSAPVNVPLLSMAVARERNKKFLEVDYYDDDGEQEIMPPHEIVARGSGVAPQTTFSVLEGVGRTLKGRDLRQVRNAIWRKTGFLD